MTIKNIGNYYSFGGMLILLFLFVFGVFMLYWTGCFNISSYGDLYNYLASYGAIAIFSLFFIGVFLYCLLEMW